MLIYHIVMPEAWAASDDNQYEAESLASEGFIHCSFEHQLDGVLQRYYSDAERVVLLEIESDRLTSKLVNEPSTGGEIYPHIYGPINRDAIVSASETKIGSTDGHR
jgi:uncharacterized protein (DUF952 family)